ncbi:hypothetical protein [Humisphaera borealis]|uniref:Uncharacterized protein n=1 Tax=Humisphaera borealis TaxID=2807512 RepID=A0A7M2WRB6_9BACT|nr:hypothetical protein [Humisphaera borealis]QOV88016.1 hypothetical protein IPV69_17310 [Humisphaera borealis]
MAKPLVLRFGEREFPFQLDRVERSDLYGYVEIETFDQHGNRCSTAKLLSDGKTIVTSGGTAMGFLSPDANWLEKKELTAVDSDNKPITPVPSSYSAPVPVDKTVTIDEYLSHNVKAAYAITCLEDMSPIMDELKKGAIYSFPYSFRGGLEANAGFLLLAADGTPFLMVAEPTKLEFLSFEQTSGVEDEPTDGEEDESLDFGMM